MTRKSKQAGGHQPLTHYERTKKFRSSNYGTTTARLSTDSQGRFGDCSLSLEPAVNPVATPSGHIYSQEAIVEYLLTKTKELKKQKLEYEAHIESQKKKEQENVQKEGEEAVEKFEQTQRATSQIDSAKEEALSKKDVLKRTSYWLADVQPEHKERPPSPPLERPPSPNSGQPLRRKDLVPLTLDRDDTGKVTCAVSHRAITTQSVVALTKSGHVLLEDIYNQLVKPTMVCPITGKKLSEKSVLVLQKGRSGFASSGAVQAKQYRPTIT